jgi:phosphoribosylformylglycinamidine (FGAM) synthase PurS component
MKYDVIITIGLKEGMLDPKARAIQHVLANPVIHHYTIEVE